MEHAAYSNAFIEIILDADNPIEEITLSEAAKKKIQKIIVDDLGVSVVVDELRTKDETELRLAELIDCE